MAPVQHLIEVVSVVLAGCARGNAADEAVLEVHAHAELVAEVAFAPTWPPRCFVTCMSGWTRC